MNHRHRKILHALFAHPVSANIPVSGVEAVLRELGAELSTGGHGQLQVRLGGKAHAFRHHGHDPSPAEVRELRRFLTDCGIDPVTQYPL